jgi:hypothetical protein
LIVRITKFLSFSNIIACLALFIALGGSVYAAGKLSGKQIKPNSLPGNRVKAKTLTGKQIKPGSLTGTQIQAGSLTGTQIQAGSLTGTQINVSTLSGVTASAIAKVQYVATTVSLDGSLVGVGGTASCPSGTNVIGGGAVVSNEENDFVNDSGPNGSRNGWVATGFGAPGDSMTVTAICTAVSSVSG